MSNVAENIARIKSEIGKTELIAVSKNHPVEKIREALAAGQRIFGENRVQEAQNKFPELRAEFPDIELHLIGALQTNKAEVALELFDVIQTVDREKLARKLADVEGEVRAKEFFIQVNIGEEEQKAGIAPQETQAFFEFCTHDLQLNITGLMCIPPANETAFMYFALLKNISSQIETHNLQLSMGMSGDYMQAVELDADYVRIGTGIFGVREV
ncbi:MAG: YggS family pyridoxal phosphate-dependent enzyme [Alphaproteobacteria bacterium CG11_big_fil_rev_8_21_14_0_20_44_7]|nr:MAG: YggS family pyridoxal phosphate-dependent enzyme [Alphaproteobacteria bacterium CG11_big_fil_rev_8_21_14_0_20_44_7]